MGGAATDNATGSGGLLPRLFTLTGSQRLTAVVFCHIVLDVAAGFPLKSMVPCVARTFLSAKRSDRPHFCIFRLKEVYIENLDFAKEIMMSATDSFDK